MISSWDLVSLIFYYQLTVKAENISKESVSCFEIELYQRLGLTIPEGLVQRTSIKNQLFQSGVNQPLHLFYTHNFDCIFDSDQKR